MHDTTFAPPDPADGWAVFFDLDGTLIDIAPTPAAVHVADGLGAALRALRARCGGALALITGRSIAVADELLPDLAAPVAGLHGAEMRFGDGREQRATRHPRLDPLLRDLAVMITAHPGLIVEDKGAGLAVHYRGAPAMKEMIVTTLEAFTGRHPGAFEVQHGRMVAELRIATASKAAALEAFMREPDFADRRPMVFGDDITDETMFAAAKAHGGMAIRIGTTDRPTEARHRMASPQAVRDWVFAMAAQHV